MNREIELKILNLNSKEVIQKLLSLNATPKGEALQKIYTYDLFPISTTFLAIVKSIEKNIGVKENVLAVQKLRALLSDLSDLLEPEDKSQLKILTQSDDFSDFINQIHLGNIPSIIFDEQFSRIVSRYDTNPNKWVRLRESGGKVTIALKQIYNRREIGGIRQHSIEDVKEIEIAIDSLEKGKQLLEELGYFHKNYQEKKRVSYVLNNVHVDIDTWPHIPSYLEIEAETEESVYKVLEQLGYKKEDAKILNADDVYTFYGLDMYSFKELKFPDSL